MGMKLLPKSEVAKAKSIDRQREIDEGIKLAKRVDGLRETAAQEEASLKLFRDKTLTKIHEEITEATKQRDELKEEISQLEEKREKALKPLDKKREEIVAARAELKSEQRELTKKEVHIDILLQEAERDRSLAKDDLQRAKTDHERSITLLSEADVKNEEAKNNLRKAIKHVIDADDLVASRIAVVEKRGKEATDREKAIILRETELNTKEKLLNDRDTAINDKYHTLMRTMQRK